MRTGRLRVGAHRGHNRAPPTLLVPTDLRRRRRGLPCHRAGARSNFEAVGADVPVAGFGRWLEEVWIPGDEFPDPAGAPSEALYLLQYLRDESHRFAITKHRGRRSRASRRSVLDSILGPGRRASPRCSLHFGSVKRLRRQRLTRLPTSKAWESSARQIHDRLHTSPGREEMP